MEFTGERFIPGQGGAIELEHLNRYYFVVHQIDLKGKTVLDIASGEGYGSNIIAKHASKVIGVDISFEAIEHAKNKYKANYLEFVQGSVVEIPMEESSVDVVVSFETLEHHDKHDEMIIEIKRVLKVDGILIISSPDKYYYSELPNTLNKYHIKELYNEQFKQLLNKYFNFTFHYSQRMILGSIIVPIGRDINSMNIDIINENGTNLEFNPVYNVAIGTDNFDFIPKNKIVLYDKSDEILNFECIKEAMESGVRTGMQKIRSSKRYLIGKFILKPFSFLKNLK